MGILLEDQTLRNRTHVFRDRADGGRLLARQLEPYKKKHSIVLAIPSGGVPVGREIARLLDCDFELLIVRKAQVPWNTEAGFGAVNLDGDIVLNEMMIRALRLTEEEVNGQVEKAVLTLEKRNDLFRHGRGFPPLQGRSVIIADDGLASGYTMRVAVQYVRKRRPEEIIVAVPTGCADTAARMLGEADVIACLNVRDAYPFAVASAYRNWYDLSNDDVLQLLD